MKSKKSALLLSFTSLLLCFAMLVGSTFAWFTDTATTGVNKIVSGKLKVDLVAADGETSLTGEGGKLLWTQKVVSGRNETLEAVENEGLPLWEPGVNFLTQGFKIANKGNLALKWKVEVNKGTTADNAGGYDLLDVIDFYVVTKTTATGEPTETPLVAFEGQLKEGNTVSEATYYIKGVMDKNAGNEYQNLTLDGITVTVYATQLNHENDSIGPDYDATAEYPASAAAIKEEYGVDGMNMPAGVEIKSKDTEGNVTVTLKDEEAFVYFTQVFDMDEARAAREIALGNGTVERYPGESVHNQYNIWYRAYGLIHVEMACDVDLHNMTVKPFTECRTFNGKGHTIKNAKVTAASGNAVGFFGNFPVENVKMDNIHVTAKGDQYAGVISGYNSNRISEVAVINSSVTGGKNTGAIVGNCYVDLENCVVEDCAISGQYKVGGLAGYACREDGEKRIINNNKLTNVTVEGKNLIEGKLDYVIGQVVGNWNALFGGECKGNVLTNVTGAENPIGEVEADVVAPITE